MRVFRNFPQVFLDLFASNCNPKILITAISHKTLDYVSSLTNLIFTLKHSPPFYICASL